MKFLAIFIFVLAGPNISAAKMGPSWSMVSKVKPSALAYTYYQTGKKLIADSSCQNKLGLTFLKKAFHHGHNQAGYELGLFLLKQKETKQEAIKYIRKSAKGGNPYSQYLLGIFYESGFSHLKPNKALSDLWHQEAAKEGIDWEAYIMQEQNILNAPYQKLEKEY